MTLEQKQEMLSKLEEAIYSGVMEIEFSDRKIKYRSLKDMKSLIKRLNNEINPNLKKKCSIVPTYNKGL